MAVIHKSIQRYACTDNNVSHNTSREYVNVSFFTTILPASTEKNFSEFADSSFTETILPLRALSLYSRLTGHQEAREASERATEYFLKHHLFKRLSDGAVITDDFLKLFYPYYWHYNILFGLKVLAEAGHIDDPRCREALSILDAKCLPDGGYPAEKKYYRVAEQMGNGCSPVDWGGTSTKHMNPFVTVEALSVCKRATVGR